MTPVYVRVGCNIPGSMITRYGLDAVREHMRSMPAEWVTSIATNKEDLRRAAKAMSGEKNFVVLIPPDAAAALKEHAQRLFTPVIIAWVLNKIKEESNGKH